MSKQYTHRVKAVGSSAYVTGFDEVKEAVSQFIAQNNHGEVYEVIDGKHVMVWKFEPYYGLVRVGSHS